MTLQPGDQAPDFELTRTPGEDPVRLADLRRDGPVVILFFPLAWSPVCTAELCTLKDQYEEYRDSLDATVVGISVDNPFALQAWSEDQGFPFPLLSDFNRQVAGEYGSLYQDFYGMRGVAKRSAFVVDQEGKVRHAEVLEDASQIPNLDAVRETLREL